MAKHGIFIFDISGAIPTNQIKSADTPNLTYFVLLNSHLGKVVKCNVKEYHAGLSTILNFFHLDFHKNYAAITNHYKPNSRL